MLYLKFIIQQISFVGEIIHKLKERSVENIQNEKWREKIIDKYRKEGDIGDILREYNIIVINPTHICAETIFKEITTEIFLKLMKVINFTKMYTG